MKFFLIAKQDVDLEIPVLSYNHAVEHTLNVTLVKGSRVEIMNFFGIYDKEISVAFTPDALEFGYGSGVFSTDDFKVVYVSNGEEYDV